MTRVARLAGGRSGVITRAELLDAGFSPTRVGRWVRDGYLRRLHPGVYAVGSAQIPWRGHLISALAAYGESAVLSHRTAAEVWGLRVTPVPRMAPGLTEAERPIDARGSPDDRRPIEVTIATGSTVRHRGVRLYRDRRIAPGDVTRRQSLPVTTVARTIRDLAPALRTEPMLDLSTEALRRGLVTIQQLRGYASRDRGRRGSAALRRLVTLLDPDIARTRSWMERHFRRHWLARDLPPYETNAVIDGDCDASATKSAGSAT